MPKVSIIMPSLNVAPYIEECIQSACRQTLTDIEILCIDAGSTDGTLEILQEFAKKDTRIRVLHSDVKSYGYQVNLGIKEATGEYVAILETDDYVDASMYETLYDAAVKNCVVVQRDAMAQNDATPESTAITKNNITINHCADYVHADFDTLLLVRNISNNISDDTHGSRCSDSCQEISAEMYDDTGCDSSVDMCDDDNHDICIQRPTHIFPSDSANYNRLLDAHELPVLFQMDANIWSGIYKREFLLQNCITLNETAGAAFQDIGFKLLVLSYATKILYIPYSGYRYRTQREGCSTYNSNVLKYAYQEFDRLLYHTEIPKTKDCKHILQRMAVVFTTEYKKLILKSAGENDHDFTGQYIDPYYSWFREQFEKYMAADVIIYEEINDCQRESLRMLLENRADFDAKVLKEAEQMTKKWDALADSLSSINSIADTDSIDSLIPPTVVLVSFGARGKEAFVQLLSRDVKVIAICDNNERVREENANFALPVLSVEDAVRQYQNAYFVVANKNYTKELETQLRGCGVKPDHIFCELHRSIINSRSDMKN